MKHNLAVPDVEHAPRLRITIQISIFVCVLASRTFYLPFVNRVVERRIDNERLAITHIEDEGKVVYLVVGPTVGSSENIMEIVIVPHHGRGFILVGVMNDVEAGLEVSHEVIGIVNMGIHRPIGVTQHSKIRLKIDRVELTIMVVFGKPGTFCPIATTEIHMCHLVVEGLAIHFYGEVEDIGVIGIGFHIDFGRISGVRVSCLEADQECLGLGGVEELIIDIDKELVALAGDGEHCLADANVGLGDGDEVVAVGIIDPVVCHSQERDNQEEKYDDAFHISLFTILN